MSRPKSYTPDKLIEAAMLRFWHYGYEATSMADLVKATGVSRHGIYEAFRSKYGLFRACLETYQTAIVTPAFAQVEAERAGLLEIARYFAQQIEAGLSMQPSPPGCLIANTMTELGPHDVEIADIVKAHHERLINGFMHALSNASPATSKSDIRDLAQFLATSAQGLWSFSRTASSGDILNSYSKTLLSLIKQRLSI